MKKKQKVLFINPPWPKPLLRDCYTPIIPPKGLFYWHPVDLMVQSAINQNKATISIIDAPIMNLGYKELFETIKGMDLQLILSLTSSFSLEKDLNFLELLGKKTKIPIAICGDIGVLDKNFTKKHPFLSAQLLSLTAKGLMNIVDNWEKNINDIIYNENIKDIIYKKHNADIDIVPASSQNHNLSSQSINCFSNSTTNEKFIQEISIGPVDHRIFNHSLYKLPWFSGPYLSILTSAGCANNCIYCDVPVFIKKPWQRPLDEIKEELIRAWKYTKITNYFFRDPLLNMDNSRFAELLEMLAKLPFKKQWTGWLRGDKIHREYAQLMRKSGCLAVHCGIESGSNKILNILNKKSNTAKMKKGISNLYENNICIAGHFMSDIPTEKLKDSIKTIKFAAEMPIFIQYFNRFTRRPGTPSALFSLEKSKKTVYHSFLASPKISLILSTALSFPKKASVIIALLIANPLLFIALFKTISRIFINIFADTEKKTPPQGCL